MPSRWCSSRTHCKLCGHKCACVCVIEGGSFAVCQSCQTCCLHDQPVAVSLLLGFLGCVPLCMCVCMVACVSYKTALTHRSTHPGLCIILIVSLEPISVNDTPTTAPTSPQVWFDRDSTWLHVMPSYPASEGFKAALGKILIWKYIYWLILIHKLGLEGKKTQDSSQLTPWNSDATFLWNWSKFSSILKL